MNNRLKGIIALFLIVVGIAIAGLGGTLGGTDSGITDNEIINVSFYIVGFFLAFLGFGILIKLYRESRYEISV